MFCQIFESLLKKFCRNACGFGGVACIKIRPNHFGVLLCQHGTADNDFTVNFLFSQKLYCFFHIFQSRCHKRTQADKAYSALFCGVTYKFRFDIFAEVNNILPIVFQKHFYNIFAYVVKL